MSSGWKAGILNLETFTFVIQLGTSIDEYTDKDLLSLFYEESISRSSQESMWLLSVHQDVESQRQLD
jgi:hypothetical protein